MEKSYKSSSFNYGLYLGILLSAFTIVGYVVSLDLFTKWWYGILMLLIVVIFGIVSSMRARKILNFISFKDSFTAYFITIVVGIVISSIVSIVIFNFIDPDAATTLQDKIIENQMQMMQRFGAPEEAIEKAMAQIEEAGSFYSIGNILKSVAYQIVGFSIVGLIVALVVKKKDPNAA